MYYIHVNWRGLIICESAEYSEHFNAKRHFLVGKHILYKFFSCRQRFLDFYMCQQSLFHIHV